MEDRTNNTGRDGRSSGGTARSSSSNRGGSSSSGNSGPSSSRPSLPSDRQASSSTGSNEASSSKPPPRSQSQASNSDGSRSIRTIREQEAGTGFRSDSQTRTSSATPQGGPLRPDQGSAVGPSTQPQALSRRGRSRPFEIDPSSSRDTSAGGSNRGTKAGSRSASQRGESPIADPLTRVGESKAYADPPGRDPFLLVAMFNIPFNHEVGGATWREFLTEVRDDRDTAVVPAVLIHADRPDLEQYLRNRGHSVNRLLVCFHCEAEFDYAHSVQRADIKWCLDLFRPLMQHWIFGFQVNMADGLDDDTPAGQKLARGAVLEWFIDLGVGRQVTSSGFLREGTTALVKRDCEDTWGQSVDFKLVSFSQPS